MESNLGTPSQYSQVENPEQSKGTSSNLPPTPPLNMDERREREDDNEVFPRNVRVGGRRDLPTYNGREDPTRYLARYKLACRANNEGLGVDLLWLFPLALTGSAADWFLDMEEADRGTWALLEATFVRRFGSDKLMDSPIRKLSIIKMKHNKNVREYIDRFNRIQHQCLDSPHLTHTITWFISGLTRGLRWEMKKASNYESLKEAFKAAMDIEDEYAASGDETDHDHHE